MNKETLQSYNTRLSNNNETLTDIVDIINELPECKETVLQDKSITITENGTQSIVADDGYDGLNSVEVTTNIENSGSSYKPRFSSFYGYPGTELNEETTTLDTSNITDMHTMFSGCKQLLSLDLSKFNTNNVTTMASMFNDCQNITTLDLSNFDTQNVTDMSSMFRQCFDLTSLDLSSFDTQNVTNLNQMFYGCNYLTSLDIKHFNTENVTTMNSMFYNCYRLTTIDLSSFKTPKLTTMSTMFYGCSKLTTIDMRNFTFDNVTSYTNAFKNIPADCLIIVKGETEKQWVLTARSDLTNVKTVAEL